MQNYRHVSVTVVPGMNSTFYGVADELNNPDLIPQVARAATERDAAIAAFRKVWEAGEDDAVVSAEIATDDARPAAPATATDLAGIRAILNESIGGTVLIDYVDGSGQRTIARRITPERIRKRVPATGFVEEEYVVASDQGQTRTFYLSRIERVEKVG